MNKIMMCIFKPVMLNSQIEKVSVSSSCVVNFNGHSDIITYSLINISTTSNA